MGKEGREGGREGGEGREGGREGREGEAERVREGVSERGTEALRT